MDAYRVQILHVADGDGGVVGIPHDLVFDLLEALDALFHQHLMDRRQRKGIFHDFPELLLIVRKSAAGTAKGKGRPQDNGIADLPCGVQTFLHGVCDHGRKHRLAKAFAQLLEQLPVLCLFNTAAGCSQ